jgi:hypothetical protein
MHSRFFLLWLVIAGAIPWLSRGQSHQSQNLAQTSGEAPSNAPPKIKVPEGVILVQGARSSASDSRTPLPEGGRIANGVFHNRYFGLTYALPPGWTQEYEGPPPSESGLYVLAQVGPSETYKGPLRGNILITAQDMFFAPLPVADVRELVDYAKDHLPADYRVEWPPAEAKIAGHSFRFFAFASEIAQLHWYLAATEIRCHTVEIVLTSRDTELLDSLIQDMNTMKFAAEPSPPAGMVGGASPVCIKDYIRDERVIARADPVFSEQRFNEVPVRLIIDQTGKVKHIHFLSAFPDQAKAITDALGQWRFKPYFRDGHPSEVETGIVFGRAAHPPPPPTRGIHNDQ